MSKGGRSVIQFDFAQDTGLRIDISGFGQRLGVFQPDNVYSSNPLHFAQLGGNDP